MQFFAKKKKKKNANVESPKHWRDLCPDMILSTCHCYISLYILEYMWNFKSMLENLDVESVSSGKFQ